MQKELQKQDGMLIKFQKNPIIKRYVSFHSDKYLWRTYSHSKFKATRSSGKVQVVNWTKKKERMREVGGRRKKEERVEERH